MYHQQFWVGRHFRGGVKRRKSGMLSPAELEQMCYSPVGLNASMKKRQDNSTVKKELRIQNYYSIEKPKKTPIVQDQTTGILDMSNYQ